MYTDTTLSPLGGTLDERARAVERKGCKLHYWSHGAEDAPVMVLLHGATLDHHTFDNQRSPLADIGFRAISMDLRGHGLSKPLGEGFSVEDAAEDLLAVLDDCGAAQAIVLGHSFGGYVAQEFLFRHPQRVRAMVVVASTDISRKSSPLYRLPYKMMRGALEKMSLESFHLRTLKDLSLLEEVEQYAREAMDGITKDEFIEIIMAGVDCLWLNNGFGADYNIPVPFLLTHGDSDTANGRVFSRQSPKWAARQKNCTYQIVPHAGHTAHMDNPEAFNAMLAEFLDAGNLLP